VSHAGLWDPTLLFATAKMRHILVCNGWGNGVAEKPRVRARVGVRAKARVRVRAKARVRVRARASDRKRGLVQVVGLEVKLVRLGLEKELLLDQALLLGEALVLSLQLGELDKARSLLGFGLSSLFRLFPRQLLKDLHQYKYTRTYTCRYTCRHTQTDTRHIVHITNEEEQC